MLSSAPRSRRGGGIDFGCGSTEGTSSRMRWRGNDAGGIASLMDSPSLLCEVEAPVVIEVAVALYGAQLEHGLRALEPPARAGDVHPILHQVATRALDHAGGDRPAAGEGGGVIQVSALV